MIDPKVLGILAFSALLNVTVALAQSQDQASGCFPGGSVKKPDAVAALIADPGALLARNPTGGARLASEVRDYVGSDLRALDALLAAVKSANPDQIGAIGGGLGQAAALCARVNPDAGLRVQQAVAGTALQPLIAAFVAGSNPIDTAAIAGGPGPAGGPPGGSVTFNTNAPRMISAPGTPVGGTSGSSTNGRTTFTFNAPSRIGGSTVTSQQTVSP